MAMDMLHTIERRQRYDCFGLIDRDQTKVYDPWASKAKAYAKGKTKTERAKPMHAHTKTRIHLRWANGGKGEMLWLRLFSREKANDHSILFPISSLGILPDCLFYYSCHLCCCMLRCSPLGLCLFVFVAHESSHLNLSYLAKLKLLP